MSKRSSLMRHTTLLFMLLAGGISMVLFSVKYQVQGLEDEHKRLSRELEDERRALHVLRAEWATLNDPRRIEELAALHLGMGPIPPAQVVGPDAVLDIPERAIVFDEAKPDQSGEGVQ